MEYYKAIAYSTYNSTVKALLHLLAELIPVKSFSSCGAQKIAITHLVLKFSAVHKRAYETQNYGCRSRLYNLMEKSLAYSRSMNVHIIF